MKTAFFLLGLLALFFYLFTPLGDFIKIMGFILGVVAIAWGSGVIHYKNRENPRSKLWYRLEYMRASLANEEPPESWNVGNCRFVAPIC